MSTIARKLCHDIVEPVLKPSTTTSTADSKTLNSTGKTVNTFSNLKTISKGRQTLQNEKKKYPKIEVSHITGPTSNKVKVIDNGIKKKLVNSAINTLISGPLRCDNNCITVIHKRNHQISCKCQNLKKSNNGSSKEIQTLNKNNYSISDKSCAHCIETVSCGTQFIDNINGILKKSNKRSKSKIAIKIQDSNETHKLGTKTTKQPHSNKESNKLKKEKPLIFETPTYVGAKHWALSNYPTRGPDF